MARCLPTKRRSSGGRMSSSLLCMRSRVPLSATPSETSDSTCFNVGQAARRGDSERQAQPPELHPGRHAAINIAPNNVTALCLSEGPRSAFRHTPSSWPSRWVVPQPPSPPLGPRQKARPHLNHARREHAQPHIEKIQRNPNTVSPWLREKNFNNPFFGPYNA
jgi:hypothetical protein